MPTRIRSFPDEVCVRIEPDHDDDILVAGADVRQCLGRADEATVGVYALVRVIEVLREIRERPVRGTARRNKRRADER